MTNLFIPGDGTVIENKMFMESNADEILEGHEYRRKLTEEEIENEKTEFAERSIKVERLNEEKAAILAEMNAKIKAETALAKKALNLIRRGEMTVTETVYLVKDQNEGMVGTYTVDGVLIDERKMRGTERQKTIYTKEAVNYKTGTDN